MNHQIEIYKGSDGLTQVEVKFDEDTVWLSQDQMASLFNQTKQNISLHITNCYKEGELGRDSTVKESLTVQEEGRRKVKRKIKYFNLDVIISVGYRVKSNQGTLFRIWATQKLKDYLIQGYAINEKRLAQKHQEIQTLKDGIRILSRAIEQNVDNQNLNWLHHFSKGLKLLDDYDHENLDKKGSTKTHTIYPHLTDYQHIINSMKSDFISDIFGKEKDGSFESAISQISKGFGTEDFYPTIEEKAAMLLYLIVKNHGFVDGNKRIAAA
jgi:hypothetical protein